MASALKVLRTCGFIVYFILYVYASENNVSVPWIVSVKVNEKTCSENSCKYLLLVRGGEFLGHFSWRFTSEEAPRGSNCGVIIPNYELSEVETTQWETKIRLVLPHTEGRIYFCLHHNEKKNHAFSGKWVHQGGDLFLDPKNDVARTYEGKTQKPNNLEETQKSNIVAETTNWADLSRDTDVNFLPSNTRPTREEMNDVEILVKDVFVPLNDIQITNSNKNNYFETNKHINLPQNGLKDIQTVENGGHSFYKARKGEQYETVALRNLNNIKNNVQIIVNNKNLELLDLNKNSEGTYNEIDFNMKSKMFNRKKREIETNASEESEHNKDGIDFTNPNSQYEIDSTNRRKKRQLLINTTNKTDDLISTDDLVKAKLESQNAIIPAKTDENHEDALIKIRKQRQATTVTAEPLKVKLDGFRVEDASKEPKIIDYSIPSVLADSAVTLRLFGEGLTSRTMIAFTYEAQKYNEPCKFLLKGEYLVKEGTVTSKTALFDIVAPSPIEQTKLYICAKNLKPNVLDPYKDEEKYFHQGTEPYKILATHKKLLPLWATLILILCCLMFSALFSGLNLGLMSLDRTELKIISNTGTEQERKFARAIMPVRDHGNYLLCSILLGNVAVNSTFTILLDELTSGLFAVIFSTLAIVLLGEITPQAICSRHGLMVGAKSIMVTKAVMALTAPLAYPVSKILDYLLGEEIGSVYNRERLKELVKVTTDVNDLDKDEVNIISGALELRKKTVSHVMTKLEDVFMLPTSSVLDFETMSEIVKSGFSRIPVYEGDRGNIVTVLFIKDLAFVDPDDNTPLRTLCHYYQNPCNFVFEDVTLDVMFKQFKEGHKGHMAFVHRINNEGEGDPFYETIGLVTLEDVIEEMIQAEILDETDVFMDNRTKRKRNRPANKLQDFAAFAEKHENQRIHISPQLTLATFQFLSTSVDAFRPEIVSETVLRRLLKQDVIQHIKLKGKTKKDISTYVFYQGKPVDYFVLILEGRVEVTVGRENLVFEAGPFTYFGVQALMQNVGVAESPTPSAMGSLQNINMDSMLRHTFVPDYSVRAITELFYLTVKRSLYLAAKRATLMEKGALSKGATNEQFDTEVDKHLYTSSLSNMPISLISKKLLGKSTSTVSSKDDIGSTPTDSKRLNIIELMQISPQQNYASSELLEGNSDKHSSNPSNKVANSWPNTNLTVNAFPTTCKGLANISTKSMTNSWDSAKAQSLQDTTTRSLANTCDGSSRQMMPEKSDIESVDASNCLECVRNNFWMSKSVLNKSADNIKNDTNHSSKKKKTTFHNDTSLLTFHDLSTHSLEREKLDSEYRSSIDADRELERDTIDFDPDCRDERSAVETIRREIDEKLLQSVDEDISYSGEHKTPSRQVSPNPMPVSASPHTRASFASRSSLEPRNGDVYAGARADEQEKLLKSP